MTTTSKCFMTVSARTGEGFPELLARCEEILWRSGKMLAPGEELEFVRPRHGPSASRR